jgi:hypothetical protein
MTASASLAGREKRNLVAMHKVPDRQQDPNQSTMKCHAAMPNLKDFDWMRDVIAGLVKYDLAEPAADDRAQHDVKKEVDKSFWIRARCVNPKTIASHHDISVGPAAQ